MKDCIFDTHTIITVMDVGINYETLTGTNRKWINPVLKINCILKTTLESDIFLSIISFYKETIGDRTIHVDDLKCTSYIIHRSAW